MKCKVQDQVKMINCSKNWITTTETRFDVWNIATEYKTYLWEFYRMLYFHLVWYTKRKLAWSHYFLLQQIHFLMLAKNQLFSTKKKKIWLAFDRVVTLDVSAIRSNRSQMFYKIGALEIFANFTEDHLCRSLRFDKVVFI